MTRSGGGGMQAITLEDEEKFLIMTQKMVRAKSLSINIEAGTAFQVPSEQHLGRRDLSISN